MNVLLYFSEISALTTDIIPYERRVSLRCQLVSLRRSITAAYPRMRPQPACSTMGPCWMGHFYCATGLATQPPPSTRTSRPRPAHSCSRCFFGKRCGVTSSVGLLGAFSALRLRFSCIICVTGHPPFTRGEDRWRAHHSEREINRGSDLARAC